jgi:Tol biopolymer transport system component
MRQELRRAQTFTFALVAVMLTTTAPAGSAAAARRVTQAPAGAITIEAPQSTFFFGLTPQFAVSHDGQHVVFVANAEGQPPTLWVRPVEAGAPRQLAGTEQASYPFWSADGRSIGFFSAGKLKTIPAAGGPVTIVCDAPTGRGGTWNADGLIVFASGLSDPLRKVSARGGTPEPATVIDSSQENSHRWPQFLPDGRHVLFWAGGGKAPAQLKIGALDARTAAALGPADSNGGYGGGRVYYKRGNALMARAIDPGTFSPVGDAEPVVEPISNDAGSFFASFAVAPSGRLLYTRGAAKPALLTWFDRTGRRLGTIGDPGMYTNATISPDGRRAAVSLNAGTPPNRDVWIVDLASGAATRLTTDPGVDATPVWSPDGQELTWSSTRSGIYQMYRRPASGSGTDALLASTERASIATDWSRDGRIVVYTRTAPSATGLDIWLLFVATGETVPIVSTNATDDNGALSPDGRWLAYQSGVSGEDQVYLQTAPGEPPRVAAEPGVSFPLTPALPARQVSTAGGTQPRWRADGQELYFLAPDGSLMAAPVPGGDAAHIGEARRILPASMTLVIRHAYTAAADGQRFLVPVLDQSTPAVITVAAR